MALNEVVKPFLQKADESSDPVERSLLLAIASLERVFQPSMAILAAKIEATNSSGNPFDNQAVTQKELEASLRTIDRIVTTTRELRSCRSKPAL